MLKFHSLDLKVLKKAIHQTFTQRKTTYIDNHPIFNLEFATNEFRLLQWKAFLRKSFLDKKINFQLVLEEIKNTLTPIYEDLKNIN